MQPVFKRTVSENAQLVAELCDRAIADYSTADLWLKKLGAAKVRRCRHFYS